MSTIPLQYADSASCACAQPHNAARRRFLGAAGVLAAPALGLGAAPAALAAPPGARLIDIHHHFEPSAKNVDGTAWSINMALDQLDQNGVDTAIAYAGPLLDLAGQQGRAHARSINEWSTRHCQDHPGRFGLFASLPMNDVDGALAEIAYALDVLKADGFGLSTQYQDAWLGDARFIPIFQELNRRRAVVFVHPSQAPCCTPQTLSYEVDRISAPWIEFPTNTARTILSLWASQSTRRFADIKFIFCHGGGVMPLLLGRINGFKSWQFVGSERMATLFPDGIYAEFAKLYFDCAQAYAPEAFDLVRKVARPAHLLFGSDFSYFPVSHAMRQVQELGLPVELRRKLMGANAAAILPRWAA